MHYYLARYAGAGTVDDPFRAIASEQAGAATIDLRPDCTVATGFCVLALPARDDRIENVYLGDDLSGPLPTLVRNGLGTRLSLTLASDNLAAILAELLMVHAREDGTRWRPLRATGSEWQIWLGGLVWRAPVIAGGMMLTENFDTADSPGLGPRLSWTDIFGDIQVVSNQAKVITLASGAAASRENTDLLSDAHWASVECPSVGIGGNGTMCRKDSSATATLYYASVRTGADIRLFKIVSGTQTQLGSTVGITLAAPDLVMISADGSTIKAFHNEVEYISQTDTAITGNLRCGIVGFDVNDILDNFVCGDLYYNPMALLGSG